MTREEEINDAVNTYVKKEEPSLADCYSFLKGIKWADEHPVNIWHDASEEPKIGSNIVVINKTGRLWNIRAHSADYDWYDIKDWICCVRTYDIQKWAYIEDLLPK